MQNVTMSAPKLSFFQFSFNGHTSVMRHYLLFSLVLIFLYIVSSHAETVTRIESGSWTEISQWSPAKVPDEKDDVVIPDGFLVDVISAVKIQSFSAAEISTLTVNANFEVTSPVPGKQCNHNFLWQCYISILLSFCKILL